MKTGQMFAQSFTSCVRLSKSLVAKPKVRVAFHNVYGQLKLFCLEYEPRIFRTMFFKNLSEPMEIFFHGVKFVVSAGANHDHRSCRDTLCQIWMMTSKDSVGDWTADDFAAKKKELMNKLKDWDKKYVKHSKTVNPELALIHSTAMEPLTKLMKSNSDFYHFNQMLKKQPNDIDKLDKLPDFR